MSDERPKAGTFFQQAQSDVELSAGGRWGFGQRPKINGTTETVVVPGPAPVWAEWPEGGAEDRLGYAIDEVPQMLTVGPNGETCGGEPVIDCGGEQNLPPASPWRRF
jgi:hypothetical protein